MRKITGAFVLSLAMTIGAGSAAYGSPDRLEEFKTKYGTGGTRLDNCITCHLNIPALNPYGEDFNNKEFSFDDIELIDSDDDGFSNIVEINAITFPGDPTDVPGTDNGCFIGAATFGFHHFSHGLTSLYQCLRSILFFFGLGALYEGPAL